MVGRAMIVIITTEAPTMPVIDAMMVLITVIDSARPPGTRRSRSCRVRSRSAAISLRSSITPMKMKQGTAISARFSAGAQIRATMLRNSTGWNRPRVQPMPAKINASPPRIQATGRLVNISTARQTNIASGSRESTARDAGGGVPRQRSMIWWAYWSPSVTVICSKPSMRARSKKVKRSCTARSWNRSLLRARAVSCASTARAR